jgi:hypothetical protein
MQKAEAAFVICYLGVGERWQTNLNCREQRLGSAWGGRSLSTPSRSGGDQETERRPCFLRCELPQCPSQGAGGQWGGERKPRPVLPSWTGQGRRVAVVVRQLWGRSGDVHPCVCHFTSHTQLACIKEAGCPACKLKCVCVCVCVCVCIPFTCAFFSLYVWTCFGIHYFCLIQCVGIY